MERKYLYRFYDKFNIQDNAKFWHKWVLFVQDNPITKIILVCFYVS